MRLFRLAALLCCLAAPALTARAEGAKDLVNELAVKVVNKSTPELCAERDNVELDFISPDVRQFTVQATHPSYIGMIGTDRWAPDFSWRCISAPGSVRSNTPRSPAVRRW